MRVRNISKMVLCYVKIHRKRIGKSIVVQNLKPCHSKFIIFHAKLGILGKYLIHVFHTLFILYFEGNHTIFGENYLSLEIHQILY